MGRKIKRVPADFDWPVNKTWSGYLMPDSLSGETCTDCKGHGDTTASQWLMTFARQLAMLGRDVADQQASKPMHPWLAENPYPPTDSTVEPLSRQGMWVSYPVLRPSEDILAVLTGLTGQSPDRFTSWLSNSEYDVYKALIKAAGLEAWGMCLTCEGHGSTEVYPGQRAEAEAWERAEPPAGEAWQLWETVSEGSPISPAFPTADGLIDWMTTPAAEWGAMGPWSRESASKFVLSEGWAPTFMASAETGLVDGVTGVTS